MQRRSFLAALSAFLAAPFALTRERRGGSAHTPDFSQPGVYHYKITYVTTDGREVDARWAAAHPQQMTARGIFYGASPD